MSDKNRPPVEIESTSWSGEGAFTQKVIEQLQQIEEIASLRVEDAPSTRSDADYNFISNEIYVGFRMRSRTERIRRWGFLPADRTRSEPAMTIEALEARLADLPEVGPPDYSDPSMIQYLRTERVIPPFQTRGYKLVELVRLYAADATPRR